MLEKYKNQKVEVAEKYYNGPSTTESRLVNGHLNKTVGVITGIDENFIELDNSILIAIKYIYRIRLV